MAIASGADILASDVALFRQTQTGTASITFTTAANNTSSVITFPVAFAAAPMMPPPNIDSIAGVTSKWSCRAINVTTTGFQIFSFSGDGTSAAWTGVPVSWCAITR